MKITKDVFRHTHNTLLNFTFLLKNKPSLIKRGIVIVTRILKMCIIISVNKNFTNFLLPHRIIKKSNT